MSDMSPRARALLRAGKSQFQPSEADRERLRSSLASRVDMQVTLLPAVAPPKVGSFPQLSTWSKVALGGAGLAAVTLALSLPPSRPGSTGEVSSAGSASIEAKLPVAAASEVASADPAPSSAPWSPPSASGRPGADRPTESPRPTRAVHTLSEEVALLSTAESALNQRRAAEALRLLRDHERRFPRGALTLERMAATAQALCMLGRASEADAQLERIAVAYPRSPQEQQARLVCGRVRPPSP